MTERQALIVIDVQQGLCEGPDAAYETDALIACINTLTAGARAADVPVIFVQHEDNDGFLTHGSREWQLPEGLLALPTDGYVRKTTPDSFLRTKLQERLETQGVKRLVVCGMHTEFCVDTTTRRALALGYPVTLVADGHSSAGNAVLSAAQVIAHHNATLSNISSFGPRVNTVPGSDIRW
ncbi:MAG TPA: cysteine hydrolase family protein [Hydrogenophaga sp.]|nr:cysteine hydrolase family protein [Hydrogenophaga sp.]